MSASASPSVERVDPATKFERLNPTPEELQWISQLETDYCRGGRERLALSFQEKHHLITNRRKSLNDARRFNSLESEEEALRSEGFLEDLSSLEDMAERMLGKRAAHNRQMVDLATRKCEFCDKTGCTKEYEIRLPFEVKRKPCCNRCYALKTAIDELSREESLARYRIALDEHITTRRSANAHSLKLHGRDLHDRLSEREIGWLLDRFSPTIRSLRYTAHHGAPAVASEVLKFCAIGYIYGCLMEDT